MHGPDFDDYEKLRAEQHEELCRLTSSLAPVIHGLCRLRACRRKGTCSGPMVPSPHQALKVRAHQEIGLSGRACADLPLCIANQAPDYYEVYRTAMEDVRELRDEHPAGDLHALFRRIAAMRRSEHNLS
ncbi:hypothetical protein [Rhizobium terrae]|uniref:hypothetical protein n=1 Tax=Rhizobium terrae TaxID=2171756 RepID=UPI000E3BD725|nr:hypothetical protein [Rhizobium terrae]